MSKEGLNLEWSARLEEIREIFEEELNKPLDDDSATRAMKGGALKLLHARQNKARRDIDAKIASRKLAQRRSLRSPDHREWRRNNKGQGS